MFPAFSFPVQVMIFTRLFKALQGAAAFASRVDKTSSWPFSAKSPVFPMVRNSSRNLLVINSRNHHFLNMAPRFFGGNVLERKFIPVCCDVWEEFLDSRTRMPQETCGFCEFAVKNQDSHRCSFSKHFRTIISDQIISELISSLFFTTWLQYIHCYNIWSFCFLFNQKNSHSPHVSKKKMTTAIHFFITCRNQQKCKPPRIQYFTNLQILVPCFTPVSLGWGRSHDAYKTPRNLTHVAFREKPFFGIIENPKVYEIFYTKTHPSKGGRLRLWIWHRSLQNKIDEEQWKEWRNLTPFYFLPPFPSNRQCWNSIQEICLNTQNNRTPLPETNSCFPPENQVSNHFPLGILMDFAYFHWHFGVISRTLPPPCCVGVSPPPCVELGSCHTPASPRCSGERWKVSFFLAKQNDDTYDCRYTWLIPPQVFENKKRNHLYLYHLVSAYYSSCVLNRDFCQHKQIRSIYLLYTAILSLLHWIRRVVWAQLTSFRLRGAKITHQIHTFWLFAPYEHGHTYVYQCFILLTWVIHGHSIVLE